MMKPENSNKKKPRIVTLSARLLPRAANRKGYLKAIFRAHNFSGSLNPSNRLPENEQSEFRQNEISRRSQVSAKPKTLFRSSGSLIRRQNRV